MGGGGPRVCSMVEAHIGQAYVQAPLSWATTKLTVMPASGSHAFAPELVVWTVVLSLMFLVVRIVAHVLMWAWAEM